MQPTQSVLLLIFSLSALPSPAALQFTSVLSGVHSNLTAVAYDGQSKFLAVGTNSTVTVGTFATDHIQWAANAGPISASLLCATYGNGKFLAGAVDGTVFSTTNGTQWGSAVSPFPINAWVMGVSYNPRAGSSPYFAAVAGAAEIAYSDNGAASTWALSSLVSPSFIESFRGVTPFGASGFAACGIAGDVRISSDGGVNWSDISPANAGSASLYGIASDGTSQLVAVGAGGALWFSSNGGTTWTKQNPVGTDLNAVAYDRAESCWVAVGNQGVVLTSSNGITWSRQSGVAGNFRGMLFSDTGSFQGVAVLVGDAGHILVGGSAPPPPTSLGDITYCEGSGPQPMQVTSNSAPANPLVTVDWYAAASGGLPVATSTFSFYPPNTNPPPNSATTNIYYAQARDLRTGFTSSGRAKVALVVSPRPRTSVTVSGQSTICNGDWTLIQATLTGVAPWAVTWASNGVTIATHTVGSSPDVLAISPAGWGLNGSNTVAYTVTSLSDAHCNALVQDVTNSAVVVGFTCLSFRTLPLTQTAEEGSTVRFQAQAETPASGVAYQWFFDQIAALTGATNALLELTNVQSAQAGGYSVVVTNMGVAITSAPALLSVIPPVQRRVVPALHLTGSIGSLVHVEYAEGLPAPAWLLLSNIILSSSSQLCFDVSEPLPGQRFYRAWQTNEPPTTLVASMATQIPLAGAVGSSVRLDYINQFGPTDAWVTLDTVTLTNTTQLYYDLTAFGQPTRLYRLVALP